MTVPDYRLHHCAAYDYYVVVANMNGIKLIRSNIQQLSAVRFPIDLYKALSEFTNQKIVNHVVIDLGDNYYISFKDCVVDISCSLTHSSVLYLLGIRRSLNEFLFGKTLDYLNKSLTTVQWLEIESKIFGTTWSDEEKEVYWALIKNTLYKR